MLKLVIFCILGFFIFNVAAIEYPMKRTESGHYVVSEATRNRGIAAMKNFFKRRTNEQNLTCENYLDYCLAESASPKNETPFFKIMCEVGIKGYLCDNAKDGEAFAELYDKVADHIYDSARGKGPYTTTTTTARPRKTMPEYD